MRREKLGTTNIRLVTVYADGVKVEGRENANRPWVFDRDIMEIAERIYRKTAVRRLRVRSIGLYLEGLTRLAFEPDLFEPETENKNRRLQQAIDEIQNRYGAAKITRGLVLAASVTRQKRLLTANLKNIIEHETKFHAGGGYAN